jgi:hypothetical protein
MMIFCRVFGAPRAAVPTGVRCRWVAVPAMDTVILVGLLGTQASRAAAVKLAAWVALRCPRPS